MSPTNDNILTAIFLTFWSAMTVWGYWGNWPPDLSGFYMAGHMFATGQYDLVFAAPEKFFGPRVDSWIDEFAKLGFAGEMHFFPYVYPPIWAAIAAPFTQILTPHAFFNAMYVINIAMTAGCILLGYRILKPTLRLPLYVAMMCLLSTFTMITVTAFVHNQIQIIVTFCILLAFERYLAGKMIQAGLILSIAAAIKITPALLGVIFLLDREYRAVAAAAFGGIALVGLSFLIAGPDLHWVFLERVQTINEQIAVMRVNYNLENLLFLLSHLASGTPIVSEEGVENFSTLEPAWISLTTKTVLIAGTLTLLWQSRKFTKQHRTAFRLFGLVTLTTLVAPLGWNHHYLPTLFLLPILLSLGTLARSLCLIGIFGILNSVVVFAALTEIDEAFHWQAVLGTFSIATVLGLVMLLSRDAQTAQSDSGFKAAPQP